MERVRDRRWTLVAVCTTTFMLLLDITIVNVALPSIQRRLHAGLTGLQWVVDAYALTLAALILTAGALADRYGRRLVFMVGVVVFSSASLLCGLAWNIAVLDVARALQGIGGAALFATALALIGAEYRGPDIGGAIAVWGATVGAAVASGPLVGGILTDALGWRWVFFVNVPVGAFAMFVALTRMGESRDEQAVRSDVWGLLTFSAALFLIVFGVLRGNASGWTSALIVGSLAGGAVLLGVFVVVELRQPRPMLDMSLFRVPAFVGVSVATFCIGAGMFALFPYLSIYFQDILGYSPLGAGLLFLPLTVFVFAVPLTTRKLAPRAPLRLLLTVGLALVALSLALMYGLNARSHWTALLPGFIVAGHRNRPREPRDRRRRAAGGRPVAHRDGLRDQQHLPPERRRDRSGGAGRDSRATRGHLARSSARPARPGARVRGQLDGDARRDRPAGARPSGDGRVRQRPERGPAGRLRGRRRRRAGGGPPDAAVGTMSFRIAAGLSS